MIPLPLAPGHLKDRARGSPRNQCARMTSAAVANGSFEPCPAITPRICANPLLMALL